MWWKTAIETASVSSLIAVKNKSLLFSVICAGCYGSNSSRNELPVIQGALLLLATWEQGEGQLAS